MANAMPWGYPRQFNCFYLALFVFVRSFGTRRRFVHDKPLARGIPIFHAIHDKIVFVIAVGQSKTLCAETTFEVDSR